MSISVTRARQPIGKYLGNWTANGSGGVVAFADATCTATSLYMLLNLTPGTIGGVPTGQAFLVSKSAGVGPSFTSPTGDTSVYCVYKLS